MSQELRVRIDDEAHAYLKAVCAEQGLTLSQVMHALIGQAQQAKAEADAKLDVVLLQLQRVQAMLEAVLAVPETPDQTPQPAAAGGTPLPPTALAALYGPPAPDNGAEHIPESFRPPPKRGFLNRIFYKVEE